MTATLGIILHLVLQVLFGLRALTRRDREPSSRAAWLLVIFAVPIVGIVAYLLLGETNIGNAKRRLMRQVTRQLGRPELPEPGTEGFDDIPVEFRHVFRRAAVVNGFLPVDGNRATIPPDEDANIEALIADIDAARDHVHLLFYIWLEDGNGVRVIEAVKRAAARGVTCRLLIDGLGSRRLARSELWASLPSKGVRTAITFRMQWLFIHIFFARIDLRNHRKIAVIDGRIGYCGSQNCADPEFLVKERFGPWVDIMMRIEGPLVRQFQHLFAIDWMTHDGEDISELLDDHVEPVPGGFPAIAIGTGPTIDSHAISDLFSMMIVSAQKEVIISTPYFVPDDTLERSICGMARAGIAITMMLPSRNDSFFVARASRSYYSELLKSGVKLYEYQGGLLHSKTLTIDGVAACIGSANMDRRSFELNYENNIYLVSEKVAGEIRARQLEYLQNCVPVGREAVVGPRIMIRAINNLFATMGPLL